MRTWTNQKTTLFGESSPSLDSWVFKLTQLVWVGRCLQHGRPEFSWIQGIINTQTIYGNQSFYYQTTNTVPFRSIRQSRITTPLPSAESDGCHADFGQVPKTFYNSKNFRKIQNIFYATVFKLFFINYCTSIVQYNAGSVRLCDKKKVAKKKNCHAGGGGFGNLPKLKFWQVRHVSRALPNWTKCWHVLQDGFYSK